MIEKHKENLIVQRALLLFLHNFKDHQIKELIEESDEFEHAWNKLQSRLRREKKMSDTAYLTIDFAEFWRMFATEVSYKTQALIIDKCINWYGKESKSNIEFSMELEEKANKIRSQQSNNEKV